MKRTIIILLLAIAGNLAAQQMTLSKGNESKEVDAQALVEGIYVGPWSDVDCWIMEGKKNVKQLMTINSNQEVFRTISLAGSNKATVLAATIDDGHIMVYTSDDSDNKKTVLFRYDIDLHIDVYGKPKAEKVEPDTVSTFDHEKKDKSLVWGAASPDGRLAGLVTIIEFTKTNEYRTQINLLGSRGEMLWEKEFALGSMKDIFVTNEGKIVTLGAEMEKEETHLIYNIISQDKEASYDVVVKCDPIREMKLVNVLGNYAVAMGTYSPINRSFDKGYTGGTLAVSFNVETAELKGFILRPFQNEDINILYNKKTQKIQKELWADRVNVIDYAPTSFGAAMVLGRSLKTENIEPDGTVVSINNAMGLHVVAADTLGEIKWVRNIRRNDFTKKEKYLLGVSLVGTPHGTCLVKTESAKYPAIYDIAKEAKKYETGSKCNMMIYNIADDGMVQKSVIEAKSKQSHLRSLLRNDGSLLVFTARGNKTRMVSLQFVDGSF